MSKLKQRLNKIILGTLAGGVVMGGIILIGSIPYFYFSDSAKLERQYQSTRRKLEQVDSEMGIIKAQRDAYVLEFSEMMAHGVRPNYKQIIEHTEMNAHGQTPSIEQRAFASDYTRIDDSLESKELELALEQTKLSNRIKTLEPLYFEALKSQGRYKQN